MTGNPLHIRKRELFRTLGYDPHPGQVEVHKSRAPRRVLACGVRWGKSTCAAMEAIAALLAPCEESIGWVVGPNYGLTERIFGRVEAVVAQHLEHRIVKKHSKGRVLVLRNVVAVYKFDRLSRRQIDFLRTMEQLDELKVGFVSVTQNLDTSTSMGRCMMNVMSAFAQLEREVISERTKDKMLASRRKGMWTGGRPILGYDVVDKKLVINEEEAERVRETFKLYLDRGSLLAVVKELKSRGWKNKTWTNKAGDQVQGGKLNKVGLSNLLKNPLYIGKVRAGGEVCDGLHRAIITQATFDAVAKQLETNTGNRGASSRRSATKGGNVLLAGLVRCAACGSAMTNHHTKKGNRRYAYSVCIKHQKEGAAACPGSRVAAGELERFVLEQIREIGRDPKLLEATIEADEQARETKRPALDADLRKLTTEVARTERKRDNLVEAVAAGGSERPGLLTGIEALEEELITAQAKQEATCRELAELDSDAIDPEELREALDKLDPIWEELFPAEKARLLDLLYGSGGAMAQHP